jgi:hypothetical protein
VAFQWANWSLNYFELALFTLGTAATHFVVSMNKNLSEEPHRSFFINWTEKMASLQHDFIYMPCDDEQCSSVFNE